MASDSSKTGTLYVVATPIGNLDDVTERALQTLKAVTMIAAEDTRHSRKLLARYGIATRMTSFHEHNELQKTPALLKRLAAGQDIALISDAGTPLISDPGYHLIRSAQERHVPVVPIPGANAAVAALSVSGLATDRYAFEGFPPARAGARRQRFAELRDEPRTLVFYEASHRVAAMLSDLAEVFDGEREAVIARELTKQFETVRRATLAELRDWLAAEPVQTRGEFVILVAGAPAPAAATSTDVRIVEVLAQALPSKLAAELAAKITGRPKNEMYRLALDQRTKPPPRDR